VKWLDRYRLRHPYRDTAGRPVLQDPLVAQRNPFEMVLLAWALFVGLLSAAAGVQLSGTLHVALDPLTRVLWAWTLVVGSGVGLAGMTLRGRWMELGFDLERFAMIVLCGGLVIYATILWASVGLGQSGLVISQNLVYAGACATRAIQITRRFMWLEHQTALGDLRHEQGGE